MGIVTTWRALRPRTRAALVGTALACAVGAVLIGIGLRAAAGSALPAPTPSAAAGPRALTTEEAERLAVTRFLAYQGGTRAFRVEVPEGAASVILHGRIDHRTHVGIATADLDDETAVITWDAATFVGWVVADRADGIPVELPAEPGGARPLDPTASSVDAVLLLLLTLAADRPENAQLLLQSDAEWLRADEVRGTRVDVIAGPSDPDDPGRNAGTTRYWIDADGALLRFEADLPSGTVSVDVIAEEPAAVPVSPQLGRP